MNEKNQYGMAMTKSLPCDGIKEKDYPPTFLEFNRILDGLSHENTIGHLFLEPLHGDFSEISYIKRFTRILNDDAFRNFFPISFEGRNNSDISIENIFIEQRRAHARG